MYIVIHTVLVSFLLFIHHQMVSKMRFSSRMYFRVVVSQLFNSTFFFSYRVLDLICSTKPSHHLGSDLTLALTLTLPICLWLMIKF
ncbi:hypothetical protein DFH28DRAFT_259615 [Melampsora americana]|nr:hypothetical protein DFH28DRAFT_259615 [Melampsora americana]